MDRSASKQTSSHNWKSELVLRPPRSNEASAIAKWRSSTVSFHDAAAAKCNLVHLVSTPVLIWQNGYSPIFGVEKARRRFTMPTRDRLETFSIAFSASENFSLLLKKNVQIGIVLERVGKFIRLTKYISFSFE